MGDSVRILTANLMNGGADPEAFAKLVRETQADIVACQELAPAQAEALAAVLPHGELAPRSDFRGMGIALRRPARHDVLPLPYRSARIARLSPDDWPELPFEVEIVAVHISAPTQRPRHRQPARRFQQMRTLLHYLDATPGRTRAVVGDFNATPSWPVYWRMALRFDDLPLDLARTRGQRPERTWKRWVGGRRLLRIDHCFGHGLVARDARVFDIEGSDHCAVVIDVSSVSPGP